MVGLRLGEYSTDIETVEMQPAARKQLRHGQIIIIRGDQVYTITGQRL